MFLRYRIKQFLAFYLPACMYRFPFCSCWILNLTIHVFDSLHSVTNLLGFGPSDEGGLVVQKDILLLLKSTFRLIRHLVCFFMKINLFKSGIYRKSIGKVECNHRQKSQFNGS